MQIVKSSFQNTNSSSNAKAGGHMIISDVWHRLSFESKCSVFSKRFERKTHVSTQRLEFRIIPGRRFLDSEQPALVADIFCTWRNKNLAQILWTHTDDISCDLINSYSKIRGWVNEAITKHGVALRFRKCLFTWIKSIVKAGKLFKLFENLRKKMGERWKGKLTLTA